MNSLTTTIDSEISHSKDQLFLTVGVLFLILCQIIDAVFTLEGINRFGIEVEGNLIVKNILVWLTPLYGMCVIKGVAISLCILLYRSASSVPWITSAVYGLNLLYISAALLPWMKVLF